MNDFIYDIPTKVYFGKDQLKHLGAELAKYGSRVLLCYGGGSIKASGLYDRVVKEMEGAGLVISELSGIAPNPRIDSVREGAEICKRDGVDVVLAVGGGSVMDAAKWVAAGAKVSFDPWKFFTEHVPVEEALPVIAMPTAAATGSEMDACGVISNPDTMDKKIAFSGLLRPKAAFEDPTNTFSVGAYQTACGSADIFSHVLETYFSMEEDLDMLDASMEGMMRTVIKYAPIAIASPDDYQARANLLYASSWAINGFATGGKTHAWSCHPIEHEISGVYDITHGLGLAILTPRWMEYCLSAETMPRYVKYGVNIFGIDASKSDEEIARESIAKTAAFFYETLGLKSSFEEIEIDDSHFSMMAEKAVGGGTLQGFVPLVQKDVEAIFTACLKPYEQV